ncbi:MAG: ribosome recycling factor [Victivallaceae bacterium]|nr:ribosome recycling factor [Victivallaceae bacterium]
MNQVCDKLLKNFEDHAKKALGVMTDDFNSIRTGKASPALIENVMVDYYGTPTRLRDLAGITAPEPRMLLVQPWDVSAVKAAEKAIIAANLGFNPVNDGKVLRVPVPELSEERRQQLTKQVKQRSEEAKVAVRNLRRDANDAAKKAQKGGEMTEDELKQLLDLVQKSTDKTTAEVDKIVAAKDKELMSI